MPGLLLEMDPQGQPVPKVPEYGFVVSHQSLELDIDLAEQTLSGRTDITILPQAKDLQTIRIDAKQCEIKKHGVLVNGDTAQFVYEDPMNTLHIQDHIIWNAEQYDMQRDRLKPLTSDMRAMGALIIEIPRSVRVEEVDPYSGSAAWAVTQQAAGASAARNASAVPESATPTFTPKTTAETGAKYQPLTISISFTTKYFRDGLQFVGLAPGDSRYPHAYTRHSLDPGPASCIFPCLDDPAMRCTWDISIKCSRTLGDAVKRQPVSHNTRIYHSKKGLANDVRNEETTRPFEVDLHESEKVLEMVVVCSGEATEELQDPDDGSKKISSFVCNTVVSAGHIGFAVGPFEQVDLAGTREEEDQEKLGQGQSIPISAYCLPERSKEVEYTCAAATGALDYFMLHFGSYPFNNYNLVFVDDQVRDTEHVAALTICSTQLIFSAKHQDPDVESTRKIVHSIASQWFGVSLVPNQRCDRWLTVGLSHYLTNLFFKEFGNNEYAFRQKTLADRLVKQDVDRPSLYALGEVLHLGSFEIDFMALKAPLVLFILDKRLLKSTTAGITRLISKTITIANTGTMIDSVLSTEGFRRLCEKLTKYRQTESFWSQWILGAGCPKFSITQKFNKKRLCVEMTIIQKQETLPAARTLQKGAFMRELKEDFHGVYAGEVQSVFTGPLTIRIHEADGTPYEHIVEIRDALTRFDIPYNTKYKRLKRNRRQKERADAGAPDISGEGDHDALYYCLGDVLQSPNEMQEWGLSDWDADNQARMDTESYEWIRMDADFEWICEKNMSSMPAYMWVSQLQQDRDVVAQQESMLYLKNMSPHPLCATFLVRTVYDPRYFYAIRAMAAEALSIHATATCNWVGLHHLEKLYQKFFCYSGTLTLMPRPNDFRDKREYVIQLAMQRAMSKIRDDKGRCPKSPRQFLLDQLKFNDNSENGERSDEFIIANLISCLTDSLISTNAADGVQDLGLDDDDENIEPKEFQTASLEVLEHYRRSDEWSLTYHNISTVTALDCTLRLMKAKVIPEDPYLFGKYVHDGTADEVRIKAFECLLELGCISVDGVTRLLLNVLSTDRSPYVRTHCFEVLCLGLAGVAFAEGKQTVSGPAMKTNGEPDSVGDDGDDGGLILEQDEMQMEARKANIARTTSIEGALAALKVDLQNNEVFKEALWDAITSKHIGLNEQLDLLDICGILYDSVESMTLKIKYPRFWKVKNMGKGVVHFIQNGKVRTKPTKPKVVTQVPRPVAPAPLRAPLPQPASKVVVQKSEGQGRTKIKFVNSATMKPPKRRLDRDDKHDTERPQKMIKFRVPSTKLQEILDKTPIPMQASPSISLQSSYKASASPATRPSPAVSASPAPSIVSSSSPGPSTAALKIRRPLPDSGRKPLPDAAPRSHISPTPPPIKKVFTLKLSTNKSKQSSPPT